MNGRLMSVRILTMGIVFLLLARWLVLVQDPTVLHPATTRAVDEIEDPLPGAVAASYVTHDPIMISSNEEFASAGFPGDGSSTNPYIIEGFNITSTETSIRIADTDAYFIIRDCLLAGGFDGDGVFLDNVTHGEISNNLVYARRKGVVVGDSSENVIANNSIRNIGSGAPFTGMGIQCWGSVNCTLFNNTISNTSQQGIHVYGGSANVIINNHVRNSSGNGIELYGSSANTLGNNTILGGEESGAYLSYSDDNRLVGNIISQNRYHGVYLYWYSDENEILDNTLTSNSRSGISLYKVSDTILANNTLEDNAECGIYLSSSPNTTVSSNTLVDNAMFISGSVSHWQQNITMDNLVNGKPLGYFWNQTGHTIEGSQYGQVILANCSGITVRDGVFKNVSPGILIGHSSSCTTVNNTIADGSTNGIHLFGSTACTILNNTLEDNAECGIYLSSSPNTTVSSNTLVDNAMFISGSVSHWQQNITMDNLVNGKPLGYFWNQTGHTIEGSQYGQVILANCSGITVRDGVFKNVSPGIVLGFSSGCSITNNTVRYSSLHGMYLYRSNGVDLVQNSLSDNSKGGILLDECRNNTIVQNVILRNSGDGVFLDSCRNTTLQYNDVSENLGDGMHLFSPNNTITHNVIRENAGDGIYVDQVGSTIAHNAIAANGHNGIYLTFGWENSISNNSIVSNLEDGIALVGGPDNILTHNTIKENGAYGVSCGRYTHGNRIHSNMLAYNTVNAYDNGTNNHWNTTGRGNYWSDYSGTGVYPIPGTAGAIDHHPAVYESVPPTVSHPADIQYEEGTTGHTLQWTPSDDHPSSYVIYRNGTQVAAASWNGSPISISVDGLSAGVYNYTLVVSDIFGNQATDTVFVIVTAQTTTTTTEPPDGSLTTLFVVFLGIIGVEAVVAVVILLRYRRRVPPGSVYANS